MPINPIGSFIDPDFETQTATKYKTNIDNSILAGKRFTDMFAPHEVNQPIETFGFTDVNISTDKITITANELQNDMAVILTNNQDPVDPPAGLVHGVTYYVINKATNDIELSVTQGGAKIDIIDQGTGINTLSPAPSMIVSVNPGFIWDGASLVEVSIQHTGTLIVPSGNPRIDRIVIDKITGIISVITGSESGSPVAPNIPDGKIPCAQILLDNSPATIAIDNTIITDERVSGSSSNFNELADANAIIAASPEGQTYIIEPSTERVLTLDGSNTKAGWSITIIVQKFTGGSPVENHKVDILSDAVTSPLANRIAKFQDGIITITAIIDAPSIPSDWIITNTIGGASSAISIYLTDSQSITSILANKVEFVTVNFDLNNNFDAVGFKWIPTVPGKYLVTISINIAGYTADELFVGDLYKNGIAHKIASSTQAGTLGHIEITAIIEANGISDYFEVFANSITDASYLIIAGKDATRFDAYRLNI